MHCSTKNASKLSEIGTETTKTLIMLNSIFRKKSKVSGQKTVILLRMNSFRGIFQEFYPDFKPLFIAFWNSKKGCFSVQNTSKRLLLIISWVFIAWDNCCFIA